ncbi:MAG: replication-relaxation family protein [bacterium]|nr:replication-relaxation family protein [bacterium]
MVFIRTPRFNRSAKTQHIRVTPRDLHIIHHVFRYRLLSSKQIATLTEGSHQNLLRRLKLLYNNRYLDRPISQLDYYRAGGSHPMIYALGNRGADLIQAKFGIPRTEIDWTAKNRSVKRLFIQHTLSVSEILVRLKSRCRDSDVEFLEKEKALRNLAGTSPAHKKLGWNVSVPFNKDVFSIGVIPDYLFGLRPQNGTDTVYFFLEVDRGTMPVMRKNLNQTSFYRKLLAYHETWRQELHTSLFGLKRFRVLVVVNSKERLSHLIAANKLLNDGKGSGIFLFASMSDVDSCENILNLPFIDGHGDSTSSLLTDIGS